MPDGCVVSLARDFEVQDLLDGYGPPISDILFGLVTKNAQGSSAPSLGSSFLKGRGKQTAIIALSPGLSGHLKRQLIFLRNSVAAYDNGYVEEAIRIGVVICVLCHAIQSSGQR